MIKMILGALLVAGIVGCPVAHADAADDQYINSLTRQGITGDRGQLIADGHAACDNYATPALVGQMAGLEARGMSAGQASNLLGMLLCKGFRASMLSSMNTTNTASDIKVRENRLRRMADRQGLRLQKSHRRDPRAYDWGTYQLVDLDNCVVAYSLSSGYGLDLDEVEACLLEDNDNE